MTLSLRSFFFCCLALIAISVHAQAQPLAQTPRTAQVMIDDLVHPWGLAFLPEGGMLISQRGGELLYISTQKARYQVSGVPTVWANGQGGLLDVLVDPDFADNQTIYLSYAEPSSNGRQAGTAVMRARLRDGFPPRLEGQEVIFRQNRKTGGGRHFGSRLVMAPDRTLFITIGDRGDGDRAQDPFDHAGAVIRINPDGSIPPDNPFADGQQGAPEIWSIGHRNAQGALWHDGQLFTVAHGARGGDEINQPRPGRNYGWPVISYGRHYWGAKIGEGTKKSGMEQPLYYWDPSIAPSGFAFWRGSFYVGALAGQTLARLERVDGIFTEKDRLFTGEFGRIRDVRAGPDGWLYLLTDENPGQLLQLRP
ncbi:MAG: PQQ-dependent sugar dehydrogenase [Pseudomonadota bacterium]